MKLSQDILFFRLLMKYPVYFLNRNTAFTDFDYPVIFEPRTAVSGHVVVICSDKFNELPPGYAFRDNLYVCVGEGLDKLRVYEPSIIIIGKNVSLFSVANDLNEIFDEFGKWDDALKSVLYESGSFQDLINCCDSIIIEPIAITDNEFQVVAFSELSKELGYNNNVEEDNRLSLDAFNNYISHVDYARLCKNRDIYVISSMDSHALSRNIFYNNEYVGSIGIKLSTGEDYVQAFNTAILRHFHIYAEKLYAKYSSFDDREFSKNSLVGILEDSINKKEISDKVYEKLYKDNRWNKSDHLQLFQFMANPHQEKVLYASYLSSKISKKWPESICFTYKDHLLLLTNISKLSDMLQSDFFQALSVFLKENSLIAGASRPFKGISCLRSAYEQTETAALYGVISDPTYLYYLFDNYVLDFMLQNSKGQYEKEDICCSKLMALIQHDNEKGTDYHKTLRTYFECKYNAAEAAKRLFINRSTFHYRLDRIQELADIDFESSDELLYLAISLKIMEIEKRVQTQNSVDGSSPYVSTGKVRKTP